MVWFVVSSASPWRDEIIRKSSKPTRMSTIVIARADMPSSYRASAILSFILGAALFCGGQCTTRPQRHDDKFRSAPHHTPCNFITTKIPARHTLRPPCQDAPAAPAARERLAAACTGINTA
ncbi:hypothetical protein PsYK624_092030 [Phanerochaete sordida]|uniref:Uncharacterized protein n=1 Tax=Phanerochaete sordida TaxID=48140 RepID=A0A9P3GEU4_9APHY|nr:hypothetical protein PsYK624_092030 [Phanerochaete sordida]